jgi:MarR family transcriptional regulator, organic hydroperoxide resistance regulator
MEWKLNQQLCFLLYANSRNIIKLYKKLLDPFQLTYTQYITMIALWENDHQTVTELGDRLSLDSGTLTPLLKKLEKDGRIIRKRDGSDERRVLVRLTEEGKKLSIDAKTIPFELVKCVNLPEGDAIMLFNLLTKLHQANTSCDLQEGN